MQTDDVASYLDAIARNQAFRVATTLKSSPFETTEVVYQPEIDGTECGPYIRKRISSHANMGEIYPHILAAQQQGAHFRHLPHMIDVHEEEDELIVLMEYVEGHTVREVVDARGAGLECACFIFPQLCDAITELHEGFQPPIIHRDIKPSNIMMRDTSLFIIDLGIARTYKADATTDTTHLGTKAYAPPEQFGYGQTDVRSDVYALGMVLAYLLTGTDPNPASPKEGFTSVPYAFLRPVLTRATAFDPSDRYLDARALRQAFFTAVNEALAQQTAQRDDVSKRAGRTKQMANTAKVTSEGQTAHPAQTTQKPQPQQPSAPASLSEKIGLVWNVIVALVWAFLMAASTAAAFDPTEANASYPLLFRILMFDGVAGCFISGVAYSCLDKRWLARHVKSMRSQTFKRGLAVGLVLVGIAFALLLILAVIRAIMNGFSAG